LMNNIQTDHEADLVPEIVLLAQGCNVANE
jgi:hypothetical protein